MASVGVFAVDFIDREWELVITPQEVIYLCHIYMVIYFPHITLFSISEVTSEAILEIA